VEFHGVDESQKEERKERSSVHGVDESRKVRVERGKWCSWG